MLKSWIENPWLPFHVSRQRNDIVENAITAVDALMDAIVCFVSPCLNDCVGNDNAILNTSVDAVDVNMNTTTVAIGVTRNIAAEADQTHRNPVCAIIFGINVKIIWDNDTWISNK